MKNESIIQDVLDLIEWIKSNDLSGIDVKAIGMIAEMVFHCGEQLKELLEMQVSDVLLDQTGTPVQYTINGSNPRPVPTQVKESLADYLKYRSNQAGVSGPSAPLFPYEQRKLNRYMEKLTSKYRDVVQAGTNASDVKSFHGVRKAGIKNLYKELRDSNVSEEKCIEKTAELFGITDRSVRDQLNDTIQPSGKFRSIGAR
jgi:integrase